MNRKIIALALALALIAVMMMPMGAWAAHSGDTTPQTTVNGDVGTTYTVTAPSTVTLPTLNPLATVSSAGQTLSVATNDGSSTTITITVGSLTTGKLTKSGGPSLSSALHIAGTGLTATNLDGSTQTLVNAASLSSGLWSCSDMVISQPAFTATVGGTYTNTLTFTASFGP